MSMGKPLSASKLGTTVLALAALCLLLLNASAFGAGQTYTVNQFSDTAVGASNTCPATCSLRMAIANVGTGGTVILPAGTYTLTNGELTTPGGGSTITITGAGARTTTIDQTTTAPTTERVLEVIGAASVPGDTLNLSGVTITGGNTTGTGAEPDSPGSGGGIFVASGGTLNLSKATVTGNTAFFDGGGIQNDGTMTIDSSTIVSNEAIGGDGAGGGIAEEGSGDTITNSTIVGNFAGSGDTNAGGGLFALSDSVLLNDTFDGNAATSGGDDVSGGTNVTAQNTIFSDTSGSHTACDAAIGSNGNNIDSDTSCIGSPGPGDKISTNPQLGPLQNNGGPTDTEAPAPGSPAIGAGNGAACPATDQRGVARPVPTTCTVGAVEGAEGPLINTEGTKVAFDTSAQVTADIDPNSADTSYTVDYGTTSAYGQQTSAVDMGTSEQTVTATIPGLQPDTTYHFRFVATNANSTTTGDDGTFTTGHAFTATAGTVFTSSDLVDGSSDGCPGSTTIDWGDGTSPDTVVPTCLGGGSSFVVAGSHTYAAAGHYNITVGPIQGRLRGAGIQVSAAPSPPSGGGGGTTTPAAQAAPTVNPGALNTATGTSATVSTTVNPNGDTTTVFVQYGTTASYGQQTAPVTVPASTAPQTVSVTITGLSPSATFHYRFVASNSGGTTNGAGASFITTTGGTTFTSNETPPPPTQGVNANVLPFIGTVLVNGQPLLVGEQIPFGATVDTTHGTVVIQTVDNGVVQTWQFATGIFVLTQLPSGETLLTLTGGNFTTICKTTTTKGPRRLSAETATKKPNTKAVRSLWGNGTGHFQVNGRYGAASVRGTVFHVIDRCDGTQVYVRHGIVAVINLKTGKIVLVTAGKSFLVAAP